MKRIRFSLLSLALSLSLLTTTMSTSATLTTTDDFTSTFILKSGSSFGVTITGNEPEDNTILPGQSIPLKPTVTNDGSIPVYVFAEVIASSDFTIDDPQWTLMSSSDSEEEDMISTIYYLGSSDALSSLSAGAYSSVFNTMTLKDTIKAPLEEEDDVTYDITIYAYAIQTSGFEDKSIQQVWEAAQ